MEIRIGRDVRTHLVHLLANTFSSRSLYLKFYIETYYLKVRASQSPTYLALQGKQALNDKNL